MRFSTPRGDSFLERVNAVIPSLVLEGLKATNAGDSSSFISDLIDAQKRGDEEALAAASEAFVRQYAGCVLAVVRMVVSEPNAVEALTHRIFVRLFENRLRLLYGYDGTRVKPSGWLRVVARYILRDELSHGRIPLPVANPTTDNYNTDIMDAAAKACKPAADFYGLPVNDVRKTLEDLAAKAMRETMTRAPAEPRLKWETDRKPDEDPAHFAWRAYAAEAAAGKLHRGLIYDEDRTLYWKLHSWLRSHDMPEGLDIPLKRDWNTRQLAKLGQLADDPHEVMRLGAVARRRAATPNM